MTDGIDKKLLSERDICTKFITPAIKDVAGWSISQFFEEFTLGKIHVRGTRVPSAGGAGGTVKAGRVRAGGRRYK